MMRIKNQKFVMIKEFFIEQIMKFHFEHLTKSQIRYKKNLVTPFPKVLFLVLENSHLSWK